MPRLKEVLKSEVHWSVADCNVQDMANQRMRRLMGERNSRYFAPVYVTHASYYWADADPSGWTLLSDAVDADVSQARNIISRIKQQTMQAWPAHAQRIEQFFSWPNDDYVFIRHQADGSLDIRITGWGFANFKSAAGGPIRELPTPDNQRDVSVAFTIDGRRVPSRPFQFLQGTAWADAETDAAGLFSFGRLTIGDNLQLRDKATGKEVVVAVQDDTSVIEIDVTEYLTVRVQGRFDGQPMTGDVCTLTYGHRSCEMILETGVAECRLPWLEGVECTMALRGEQQTRQLEKLQVNVFNFDLVTPAIPTTLVRVHVDGDGHGIEGEAVSVRVQGSVRNLTTNSEGIAETRFDTPSEPQPCTANVRGAEAVETLAGDVVDIYFNFDTPQVHEFDASLLVVNSLFEPLPGYPVIVRTYNGVDTGRELTDTSYITDENGRVNLGRVVSGSPMTVTDGNDSRINRNYVLDYQQPEYVFMLPYAPSTGDGAYTLRVIEKDNRPAAGVTCILTQGDCSVMSILNDAGEIHFSTGDFVPDTPINVGLYSARRTFPKLNFTLEKDEYEYELKEVTGPYPWWKILLEILAVIAVVLFFMICMGAWGSIFRVIPYLFS